MTPVYPQRIRNIRQIKRPQSFIIFHFRLDWSFQCILRHGIFAQNTHACLDMQTHRLHTHFDGLQNQWFSNCHQKNGYNFHTFSVTPAAPLNQQCFLRVKKNSDAAVNTPTDALPTSTTDPWKCVEPLPTHYLFADKQLHKTWHPWRVPQDPEKSMRYTVLQFPTYPTGPGSPSSAWGM